MMRPILFALISTLIVGSVLSPVSAAPTDLVTGYAWSDNIGWISFNNVNHLGSVPYGVTVRVNGDITGYAWSDNIGWISFETSDTAACPIPGSCKATIASDGTIQGMPRALSWGDGWSGWIQLSGVAADGSPYGVRSTGGLSCQWKGWAWGGDVIGWVSFDGPGYGVSASGAACGGVVVPPPPKECSDSIDNDGDGRIDYPADLDCDDPDDTERGPYIPQCRDKRDNDGDLKIDFNPPPGETKDPGCDSPDDDDERDTTGGPPQCSDSIDNDGDGEIDYPDDLGCVNGSDNNEFNRPGIKEIIP